MSCDSGSWGSWGSWSRDPRFPSFLLPVNVFRIVHDGEMLGRQQRRNVVELLHPQNNEQNKLSTFLTPWLVSQLELTVTTIRRSWVEVQTDWGLGNSEGTHSTVVSTLMESRSETRSLGHLMLTPTHYTLDSDTSTFRPTGRPRGGTIVVVTGGDVPRRSTIGLEHRDCY